MGYGTGGMIHRVQKDSLARHLGIRAGDRIISIDGREPRDELDVRFYSAEPEIMLVVGKSDGSRESFQIEKDPEEPLGISFSDPVFDGVKTCANSCVFCFVRQIPEGMRGPLHIRDDDYRLSFLYGNYLSLTNLGEADWARIREQRISPLRVSVHTTDPDLRQALMGNPEAARIMEQLSSLTSWGIEVHAQIVLLRGTNDGEQLEATLRDLDSLGKNLVSVGVVPAVYTRYRKALPSAAPDPVWARETLDVIESYAEGAFVGRGERWVWGADEFYLVAGRPVPPYEYYGGFHQYENGIGMVADFEHSLRRELESSRPVPRRRAIAVTGLLAYPQVKLAVLALGLSPFVSVCPVKNTFYGDSVTVSGLLTGQDVAAAVLRASRDSGPGSCHVLAVPDSALFEGAFLDDLTLQDLSAVTGIPAVGVPPTPRSLREIVASGEG